RRGRPSNEVWRRKLTHDTTRRGVDRARRRMIASPRATQGTPREHSDPPRCRSMRLRYAASPIKTEEPSDMSWLRLSIVVLLMITLGAGPAVAETVLRIGLNDVPDALDPTISRAYVGRLVFAALCDKLFDVTPDLKIVPQLATSYEWTAG